MENVILFTDLNDPDFKPEENGGVDYDAGTEGEGGREGRWERIMLEADAIVYFCQRLEIERNTRGKGKDREMMLSKPNYMFIYLHSCTYIY